MRDRARWTCIQSAQAQQQLLRLAERRFVDVLALRADGTVRLQPTMRGVIAAIGLCKKWGCYREAKRIEKEFLG